MVVVGVVVIKAPFYTESLTDVGLSVTDFCPVRLRPLQLWPPSCSTQPATAIITLIQPNLPILPNDLMTLNSPIFRNGGTANRESAQRVWAQVSGRNPWKRTAPRWGRSLTSEFRDVVFEDVVFFQSYTLPYPIIVFYLLWGHRTIIIKHHILKHTTLNSRLTRVPRDMLRACESYAAGKGAPIWIPFGDHPYELERYRED